MLDQENKTHAEQSTLSTNNSCKLSNSNPSTFRNNPLNDHDYCSKAKQQTQPQQQQLQSPQTHPQPQQNQRQPSQQTRVRKPRQNTSVTDKSQWITGEEQVDSALSEHIGNGRIKRQRKEVHDPEFSQLSSSEYSSSDAGSDPDSECDSEEDPNKPWCTCEQPDDGSFMIACEICEYWFHGKCVGMTEALAKRRAKENKEWFCSICDHALQSGTPRDAIPRRLVKKEKKKTATRVKRRRGRPRKSHVRSPEATTRLSLRSAKRANSSIESNLKFEGKSNARVESFKKFDDQQRLKELIRERKKEFFRKRNMDTQIKVQKIKDIGLGRQSITDSMGHSLDTVASSTNSPNMNNLPINIKSEHKVRPKPNIVLQINTKKDGATEASGQRLVTAIVKKRKTSESCNPTVNELFTDPIIQPGRKSKSQAIPVITPTPSKHKVSGDTVSPNSEARAAETSNDQSEQQSVQKIRKRKESNSNNGSSKHVDSMQIIQKIKECLNDRGQNLEGLDMKSIDTEKLASDIEEQLNECFKVGSSKYLPKYRSLIFNLRDPKNQALVRNVLTGFISPSRLVRMSPDEMAPNELSKWREMENKHSIELIKRDAELAAQQVIVKKTHKGEEVIAAPEPNEPDDPTAAKEDQEIPSTPTKTPVKLDTSKVSISPSIKEISKNGASAAKNLDSKLGNESQRFSDPSTNSSSSIGELVGTQGQASEVTSIDQPSTSDQSALNSEKPLIKEEESREPKVNQPKRLRISIDSKLDPANLSRLTQPLLKREIPPESVESSPSKMSPNAGSGINDNFDYGNESEELYDPEIPTMPERVPNEVVVKKNPKSQCWSGTIAMSEVGKFNAFARPVSGDLDFMKDEISRTLMVCGRIALDNATSYIKKIISTQKNQICLVQLYPLGENDRATYDTFFEHLYTRNRYGVINTNGHQTVLKDFYVLPIHEKGSIPEVLRPINGPGLDRKETNCLLGLLVKANRPSSATSSVLNYTPSSIK